MKMKESDTSRGVTTSNNFYHITFHHPFETQTKSARLTKNRFLNKMYELDTNHHQQDSVNDNHSIWEKERGGKTAPKLKGSLTR